MQQHATEVCLHFYSVSDTPKIENRKMRCCENEADPLKAVSVSSRGNEVFTEH